MPVCGLDSSRCARAWNFTVSSEGEKKDASVAAPRTSTHPSPGKRKSASDWFTWSSSSNTRFLSPSYYTDWWRRRNKNDKIYITHVHFSREKTKEEKVPKNHREKRKRRLCLVQIPKKRRRPAACTHFDDSDLEARCLVLVKWVPWHHRTVAENCSNSWSSSRIRRCFSFLDNSLVVESLSNWRTKRPS